MNILEQAKEAKKVFNDLSKAVEGIHKNIVIPSYNSLSKEDKEQFNERIDSFVDNMEVPDIKEKFSEFANKHKK